jgi:hypothetical protein
VAHVFNDLREAAFPEPRHLTHPLVQNGDDADIAMAKPPPAQDMAHAAEEVPVHIELGRYGP